MQHPPPSDAGVPGHFQDHRNHFQQEEQARQTRTNRREADYRKRMHDLKEMQSSIASSGYGQSTHANTSQNTSVHFAEHKERFIELEDHRQQLRNHRQKDYRKRMHDLKEMQSSIASSALDHDTSEHFQKHNKDFHANQKVRSTVRHNRTADYMKREEDLNYMKKAIPSSGYGIHSQKSTYDRSRHFDQQHEPAKAKPVQKTARQQQRRAHRSNAREVNLARPASCNDTLRSNVARRGSQLLNDSLDSIEGSPQQPNAYGQQQIQDSLYPQPQPLSMPAGSQHQAHQQQQTQHQHQHQYHQQQYQQPQQQQPVTGNTTVHTINQHWSAEHNSFYYHNILTGKTGWLLHDVT